MLNPSVVIRPSSLSRQEIAEIYSKVVLRWLVVVSRTSKRLNDPNRLHVAECTYIVAVRTIHFLPRLVVGDYRSNTVQHVLLRQRCPAQVRDSERTDFGVACTAVFSLIFGQVQKTITPQYFAGREDLFFCSQVSIYGTVGGDHVQRSDVSCRSFPYLSSRHQLSPCSLVWRELTLLALLRLRLLTLLRLGVLTIWEQRRD